MKYAGYIVFCCLADGPPSPEEDFRLFKGHSEKDRKCDFLVCNV